MKGWLGREISRCSFQKHEALGCVLGICVKMLSVVACAGDTSAG